MWLFSAVYFVMYHKNIKQNVGWIEEYIHDNSNIAKC